jgi:glycosyltransferase involved in cell wall biosynthesis
MPLPFVSVLTPTYNRRAFIPAAIACFKAQTYPMDRIEWIVLDDGTDKVGDLFAASGLKNVRYIALPEGEKLPIGAKRNRLNELATGDICVCWDDDDYYVPDRIRKAVTRLRSVSGGERTHPVAGSSQVLLYFGDTDEIWSIGPFGHTHCTNGTMAYWRSYAKTHRYDDTATKAEEKQFMADWTTQVIQISPEDTMLVICHNSNTFDKRRVITAERPHPTLKLTSLKLKNIIKDKALRDFYVGASKKPVTVATAAPAAPTTAAAALPEIVVSEIPSTAPLSEQLSLPSQLSSPPPSVPQQPPACPPSLPSSELAQLPSAESHPSTDI